MKSTIVQVIMYPIFELNGIPTSIVLDCDPNFVNKI